MTKWILLVAMVAGCSSSGPSSSSGSSGSTSGSGSTGRSSSTGGTTTTGSSGPNSLTGQLAFPVAVAILNYSNGPLPDAGRDLRQMAIVMTDGTANTCAARFPDAGQLTQPAKTLTMVVERNDGGLTPGAYPVPVAGSAGDADRGVAVLQYADTAFGLSPIYNSNSGSVTISAVSTEAMSGSFSVEMVLVDGGGSNTLTGNFSSSCIE